MDSMTNVNRQQINSLQPDAKQEKERQGFSTRTVSPTPANSSIPNSPLPRGKAPAVDQRVFTIRSDVDRQSVLAHFRQNHPGQPVVLIRTPDDVCRHQLVETVTCAPDGKLSVQAGPLLAGQSVTPVLDLTEMPPGQVASLNDLLDTPPRWEEQPLSKGVRRVCLVDANILTGAPFQPGPDCVRRLKKISGQGCLWTEAVDTLKRSLSEPVLTNSALLAARVKPVPLDCPPTVEQVCDMHAASHWRTLLFGGLTLDDQGQAYFQTGKLAELGSNARLTLVDAPWESLEFTDALATALRENGFTANGQWVALPQGLQLFRQQTGAEQLAAVKRRLVQGQESFSTEASFVCLNGTTLESVLGNSQIGNDGVPRTVNTLTELLKDAQQLCITSPLSDQQWLRLLRRLEALEPRPVVIDLAAGKTLLPCPGPVQCQFYRHRGTALTGSHQDQAQLYSVTDAEQWHDLWRELSMVSRKEFRFARQHTPLLKALETGKPVILEGLHHLPKMMAHCDSLLASPPYLWIDGQKITLPRANITLLWPDDSEVPLPPFWQARTQPSSRANGMTVSHWLLTLLKCLPPSSTNAYPKNPPWTPLNFAALLERQIERERVQDRAADQQPIHIRRALHTLIAKNYRGDRRVYDYLKTMIADQHPDPQADLRADRDALGVWLVQHPDVDRQALKQHFWSLVRHCSSQAPDLGIPAFLNISPGEKTLDVLASYLVGSAPAEQQAELAVRLGIKTSAVKGRQHFFSGQRRSRLRDALLAAGEYRLQTEESVSQQVWYLGRQIDNAMAGLSPKAAIQAIDNILREALPPWLMEQDFADLPQALFFGESLSRLRQLRRMERLTNQVQDFPLVHLQGESGAGKSHMARVAAAQLQLREGWQDIPEPLVLNLGPQVQAADLYGGQQVQELIDGDSHTQFEQGPLLQWAQQKNPPVLIIRNANLAAKGLLAPLAGLTEQPPVLRYRGQVYPLTAKHRGITIADLDGPPMDSALQGVMLTLHYRPLAPETLAELLVGPALPRDWPKNVKEQTVSVIMSLYQHFNRLLPEPLTAADLQDVLAHMELALSFAKDQPITRECCHALVWQSFYQQLAGLVSVEQQPNLQALEDWYRAHYPGDRTILAAQEQAFDDFHRALGQRFPQVDLDTGPVVNLVRYYWLFLNKQQQNGDATRRALIVEGPAGWGKDLLLDCVLDQWETEHPPEDNGAFIHTSAKPGRWDILVQTVKQAMADGRKLVISELNLLPRNTLAGLFSNVLSGPKKAGFALLATINPSCFSGRDALSAAVNSCANRCHLTPLSTTDLSAILGRRGYSAQLVDWLVCRFLLVNEALDREQRPLRLTLDDLFAIAEQLHTCSNPQQWSFLFAQGCGLELQALSWSEKELEWQVSQRSQVEDKGRAERQQGLSTLINSQQPAPIIVRVLDSQAVPHWEPASRTLTLPDTGDLEQMRVMAEQLQKEKHPGPGEPGKGGCKIPYHFPVKKYFSGDNVLTNHYRLSLTELTMADGRVNATPIPCDRGGVEPLPLPSWSGTQGPDQHYGSTRLQLCHRQWQPLPGVGVADRLVGIRIRDQEQLSLTVARGRETGQLLVKLADSTDADGQDGKTVTGEQLLTRLPSLSAPFGEPVAPRGTTVQSPQRLDFLIEANSHVRTLPVIKEPVLLMDNLCDPGVRKQLDRDVFGYLARCYPGCNGLQQIWRITPIGDRLRALAKWVGEFKADKAVAGQGLELLINMIKDKQSGGRHHGQIFCLLAAYLGLPARMVGNDLSPYVEISTDGGRQWQGFDFGAHGDSTWTEYPEDFVQLDRIGESEFRGESFGSMKAGPIDSGSVDSSPTTLEELDALPRTLMRLCDDCLQATSPHERHSAWSAWKRFTDPPLVMFLSHLYLLNSSPQVFAQLADAGYPMVERLCEVARTICHPVLFSALTDGMGPRDKVPSALAIATTFLRKIKNFSHLEMVSKELYLTTARGLLEHHWSAQGATDQVLPILEDLAADPPHRAWAEARLAEFYASLTRARTWGEEQDHAQDSPDVGGYSTTLLKGLQQSCVDIQWGYLSQGEPPDMTRLALGQPCFPRHQEQLQTRKNVLIPWLRHYDVPRDVGQIVTAAEVNLLSHSYQNWLVKLGRARGWQCLVSPGHDRPAGCYPISIAAVNLGPTGLNMDRLKQSLAHPETQILLDYPLQLGFEEFARSVDRERLRAAAESRRKRLYQWLQ